MEAQTQAQRQNNVRQNETEQNEDECDCWCTGTGCGQFLNKIILKHNIFYSELYLLHFVFGDCCLPVSDQCKNRRFGHKKRFKMEGGILRTPSERKIPLVNL